ncbi:MAG TPA: UDP-N-acetylmuramoyl-L-alanine--D-glutamate ligase [Vicinamibacteria bacterium]|nr:UDP-N-acetylmuramoyl-L-alanine--D-glutamate ligase [Vicinamibacteria bacterium]
MLSVSLWLPLEVREVPVELAGKQVVVVGLARSGVAAARLCARQGARVVATDRKGPGQLPAEVMSLEKDGVRLELGAHRKETFASASLIVVSPGVPSDVPELQAAREAGVPVLAELELGWRLLRGTAAAVTGTKGKSTTTAAAGAMLREAGGDVRVGGNIGQALTGIVEGSTAKTVFVLEVSSFQLEGTDTFRPHVAVFLNLSPDHLDRHASFEEYAQAKARIFANQTEEDWAVVNAFDPAVLALARRGRARKVAFHPLGSGSPALEEAAGAAFFDGAAARLRANGRDEVLFDRADVHLPGDHLASDLLAAGATARLMGAAPEDIRRAVRAFAGAEHVLEKVAVIRGVAFFNDSKATNVEAALKSLEAFASPVLPILGGRYKGGDFALLAPALRARGKAVLAIGEATPRIAEALAGVVPVVPCGSMAEAVERAFALAVAGDTVVLAPACSSFDMFEDYAARGLAFKDEVRRLVESSGDAGARTPDG